MIVIQYGTMNLNVVDNLYNVLNGVYIPMLLENKNWPESMHLSAIFSVINYLCAGVKRDFLGQLHRFMASLTEMSFQAKGVTVLYIPSEDLSNIDKAAKDKDLIQRLEGTLFCGAFLLSNMFNSCGNSLDQTNQGSSQSSRYCSMVGKRGASCWYNPLFILYYMLNYC